MDEAVFQHTLLGARGGSRRALTELYANYDRMLVRYLRAAAPGLGEELAHQTWMSVAAVLPAFEGDERTFRMLLLATARKRVQEFKKSPIVDLTDRAMWARAGRPALIGDEPVTDAAIAGLLEGLRPLHAEILLLRVVGGLSAEETGTILGKDPAAIRQAEHRALTQIARRLAREQNGDHAPSQ